MKRPNLEEVSSTMNSSKKQMKLSQSVSSLSCLRRFQDYFNNFFYNLGYLIGRRPSFFIIIPIFITLIGITGVQRIKFENHPDFLFVPTDGLNTRARDSIEEMFPADTSNRFDPSRKTRNSNFAKLLVTAKDNGTMFRLDVWDDVILLDQLIQSMTIKWENQLLNYTTMCSKWEGKCFENIIYNLNEIMPEVANKSLWVSYPVMLFPLILPLFFGGVVVNETEGVLITTQGVYTTYFLAEDNWKQKERAYLWEGELLNLLQFTEFEYIKVAPYTSRSLQDELDKNSACLIHFLPYSMVLLFLFCIFSVAIFDWVRTKIQMGVLGLLTVILASCASFGVLIYIGVPFVGINAAAIFLMLGIGLDDMFVVLAAWRRTKLQDTVPKRMAETYREVAVSITVTTLTNLVAFSIGTLSTFPAIHIFCIYLGTATLFTYIWFITFFGGCLAIIGYVEKGQKHVLSCRTIKARSEVDERECCYRLWCTGGINKADPWNVKDNQPNVIAKFFRDQYGKGLNLLPVKAFVIFCFFVYLSGAIYGFLNIKQGVDKYDLNLDDSYLRHYYSVEDAYFRKFPYRIQVVITGNLTFSDEATKEAMLDLHEAFENMSYVGPRLYSTSWIRGFYGYLRRNPALRKNVTDEASFISLLRSDYLTPFMKESLDVHYNEDYTRIVAARFVIQGYEVKDLEEDLEMVRNLREIASKAPFEVLVFHPSFVLYDQYLIVASSTIVYIALAAVSMIIISFFFVPNPLSAVWIGLSVVSINFGVIGYMSMWSVRLDTISLVNLIMSIGFSVDFTAHISHSYLNSQASSVEGKLRQSLYEMGLPVLQGGFSTIIAIFVFILTPSYIYRTFFKIIFLVIAFGILHSLVFLPVMLSLFDKTDDIKNDSHTVERYRSQSEDNSSCCESRTHRKDGDLRYRTSVTDSDKFSSGQTREYNVLTCTNSNASSSSSSSEMTSISISSEEDVGGISNPTFASDEREVERL